ncbi:hypothetical protein CPB85DRAFT_1446849 [Mucidula mucida]|nr:hypothetical protein CPB85DRAFT_1446849 [Mucidula mucida]
MSASDTSSHALPSGSSSSVSLSADLTVANIHLFQRDDPIVQHPRAYLNVTVDASRSLGINLAYHSALTQLVYSKMRDLAQNEYLTAHVAPLIDGVLHRELSVEVDLKRYRDADAPQSSGNGHLAALLRNDPRANLFGVSPEAKQHNTPTPQSLLDAIRHHFSSISSSLLSYNAADYMVIHRAGGHPIQRPPLRAQAIMEFLHPEQDPFNLERLAALFAFYSSDVAPSYNVVEQNCYHMSAWIWHAVAHLAQHVRHQLLDLEPMGKYGLLRTVVCMHYGEHVDEKVLERAKEAWNHWERRFETASEVKWKEARLQRHISALSAERVSAFVFSTKEFTF